MTNIVVGYPMNKAGNLYINGLALSYLSTADIFVTAGAARDNTDQCDIVIPAAGQTAIITNGGLNGLDTGTVADSTLYYVFVVGSSLAANPDINIQTQVSTLASGSSVLNGTVISEGTVTPPTWSVNNNYQPGVLFSLSPTAPTLPEGYDMFRRIGAVLTDGSAYILEFWQGPAWNDASRWMWYDAPVSVLSATPEAAFTSLALTAAVPPAAVQYPTVGTMVKLQVDLDPAVAADFVAFRPTGSTNAGGQVKVSGAVATVHEFAVVDVFATLNTATPPELSIDYITDASSTVALHVIAYVDNL